MIKELTNWLSCELRGQGLIEGVLGDCLRLFDIIFFIISEMKLRIIVYSGTKILTSLVKCMPLSALEY